MYLVLPYNWSLVASFLFTSILSIVDPVGIISILNNIGTPHTLSLLIEGQSLLNDGSSVVGFEISMNYLLNKESGILIAIILLIRLVIGGLLLGVICGYLTIFMLSYFHDKSI